MSTWVATDKSGKEFIYSGKPTKEDGGDYFVTEDYWVPLPKGSIERLIGRPLTWEDAPVELTQDSLTPKS